MGAHHLNGILCAEFYWTVSLMFALSNSVLPVGLYHHLMFSMPTFVTSYDEAIEAALEMPEGEQRHRMETMTAAVEAYTVKDWAEEQLAGFPEVATVG